MTRKERREEERGKKGTTTSSKPAEKKEEFFTRRKKKWGKKKLLLLGSCKRKDICGSNVSTPIISWKEVGENTIIKGANNPLLPFHSSFSHTSVPFSVRKLGSIFWEFQHYFSSKIVNNTTSMYLGVNNHHQRARRLHHRVNKDQGFDHHNHHNHGTLLVDPHQSGSHDHQPESAGSLRRHIAASLMKHHQSTERNKHALQPLSPASYGSSLEIAPYNPAATPESSIELRERTGDPRYGFKTSTELLKVLNRIWTLEEQHASNIGLVKALKNELNHARVRIKELLRDQQTNRDEIDDLMKQISRDDLARNDKEHERLEAALQSVRDELEDERKLRKRSESLHRKLARELFEVKVDLSSTVKELEKERKSRELLEDLCDEFAKSIGEYSKQARDIKQKSEKEWSGPTIHDNLILHISESWLDEREQKRERGPHKASIVDKLRPEIESFLTARETANRDNMDTDHKETRLRRRSLESIPEVGIAPSIETTKVGSTHHQEQEEVSVNERRKGQSLSSVQLSEPKNTAREMDSESAKTGQKTPTEINMLQKSEIYDSYQKKKNYNEEGHGFNSKTVDKLMSELLMAESGSLEPEYEYKETSSGNPPSLRRNASPVRQWVTSMKSPGPKISESSSKLRSVRENSLKAKLQEPKSKGQRSRLKILKGSS